ncbi:PREDICTED: frizzled-8 [Cercocebus atys]|uniref:frizzled-8 n=1 Tax=Cercocebus atys TaxID=9531 RepID=UPI0005F367CA|nr:PREDICTED: frizzled-8 [Cercocebus atys]
MEWGYLLEVTSLLAALALLQRSSGAAAASAKELACQEITVPLCKGIGYNYTYMPNQFNHDTQDEAGLEVHQFWPLVEIQCSPDLKFFLCSMYTPICLEDYKKPLPPCRSVCERAKAGCAPLMRQYGFAWPDRMRCDRLPEQGNPDTLCMDYNRTDLTTAAPSPPRRLPPPPPGARCQMPARPMVSVSSSAPSTTASRQARSPTRAALPQTPFFSQTSAAVHVFCIVPVAGGPGGRGEYEELGAVEQHVRYETTGPALCTVVFLLVYFFGMASSIWWVILSLTWFLAAGMKWGNEAIAGYSQYFHLAAWLVPSVKSIAVLALSSVDGDPVAGICYVGNQSLDNLRGFVLAPLVIYLFIGTMFLLAGFVSLFRIRSVIKQQDGPTKTHKLEKLMIRLGLFTVLYTVPAAVVVACLFYEQHNRPRWEATHNCPCLRDLQPDQARRPDYAVFMLKYFMCLVVGITSGVWVWSGKTLESWRSLCTRCCWASKGAAVGGGAGATAAGGGGGPGGGGGGGPGGGGPGGGAGSLYSDVSTGLTWRSGTASSVSYPKQMPLSQV